MYFSFLNSCLAISMIHDFYWAHPVKHLKMNLLSSSLLLQSSKNKENTPLLSQSQSLLGMGPQPHSGLSRSWLSSEESLCSLKELWETLDHGLSPSIVSEGNYTRITRARLPLTFWGTDTVFFIFMIFSQLN